MNYFHTNIVDQVEKNTYYRKVLYTVPANKETSGLQVVVMSIPPKTSIGMEMHEGTQSITIHSGKGKGVVDGEEFKLEKGDILVIPPYRKHNITNRSAVHPLDLVSYYTPPEHPPRLLQKNK